MNQLKARIILGSIVLGTVLFVTQAFARQPVLINPQTGQYLGNYNSNQYDPNSISNPYGKHGSKYMPDSVNNPYGRYGSRYSPDSVNNPYGYNAPAIVAPNYYQGY